MYGYLDEFRTRLLLKCLVAWPALIRSSIKQAGLITSFVVVVVVVVVVLETNDLQVENSALFYYKSKSAIRQAYELNLFSTSGFVFDLSTTDSSPVVSRSLKGLLMRDARTGAGNDGKASLNSLVSPVDSRSLQRPRDDWGRVSEYNMLMCP